MSIDEQLDLLSRNVCWLADEGERAARRLLYYRAIGWSFMTWKTEHQLREITGRLYACKRDWARLVEGKR